MNDSQLIHGCIKQDKKAWDFFVDRFSNLIYDSIIRTMKQFGCPVDSDTLDDIYHDIFVRILEDQCKALKIFEGRNGCQLAHYLRTIAVRKTIDYLRKLKPMVSIDQEEDDDFSGQKLWKSMEELSVFTTHSSLQQKDTQEISQKLLAELKPEERRLCEMVFYEGKKSDVISKQLGISIDYFYVVKQRILDKLRKVAANKKLGDEI